MEETRKRGQRRGAGTAAWRLKAVGRKSRKKAEAVGSARAKSEGFFLQPSSSVFLFFGSPEQVI